MTSRTIPILAALIALSRPATAGVPLFGHVSCTVVRFYVAKYSEPAAEKWARSHGASDAEIETARHCLHSTDVQIASRAPRSQVVAAVSGHEGTQHEPDGRDEDALHVPVDGQRANPEQDSHDDRSSVHNAIRPKEIEDRSAGAVSKTKDDLVPFDGKAVTLRPRNVDAVHRAYRAGATRHEAWFKRLWDHLTRRSQFTVAFLHLNGGRR
jgi:hypothetical protein